MSDAAAQLPATTAHKPPATEHDKPKRLQVRGKLRLAILIMIEQGKPWNEAAQEAGYTVAAMRKALQRAHVLAFLKAQRLVFRAAICAANDLRLAAIRDQDDNKSAAVQAVRALERMTEHDDAAPASAERPGLVVVVNVQAPDAPERGGVVRKG